MAFDDLPRIRTTVMKQVWEDANRLKESSSSMDEFRNEPFERDSKVQPSPSPEELELEAFPVSPPPK